MRVAYVDSSCIVAIALGETGWKKVQGALAGFRALYSSNLLEAEVRSALAREGVESDPEELFQSIGWVLPSRSLGPEIATVLDTGYARGADLWHLATALYVATDPARIAFETLDGPQRELAAEIGFKRR